jgi:hypothetical protein
VIVRLRVARLTLAVRAERPLRALGLPARFHAFRVDRGSDIDIRVVEDSVPEPEPGSSLFDSGGLWGVHRHRGGLLYMFREPRRGSLTYKALAIDEDLRRGRLYLPTRRSQETPGFALAFPLDELLFQHRLAREGGFEVHACGVAVESGMLLFCGASGAGKTTIAQLWARHDRGARVLSDDRIALRLHKGRFWAYGTPWHGSGRYGRPEGRPLAAVIFLKHGPRSRLRSATVAAGARLFARAFPPLWDAPGTGRVLEACGEITGRVPAWDLTFRRDRSAVDAVRQGLRNDRALTARAGSG